MISRFFKRKTKSIKRTIQKKKVPKKPIKKRVKMTLPNKPAVKKKKEPLHKILTAEGWKRLMMRKYSKGK